MTEKTITIPVKEYERLVEADNFLSALLDAGVDNWQGYDYAIEALEQMKEESGEDDE